jgi:hypothetical protein
MIVICSLDLDSVRVYILDMPVGPSPIGSAAHENGLLTSSVRWPDRTLFLSGALLSVGSPCEEDGTTCLTWLRG